MKTSHIVILLSGLLGSSPNETSDQNFNAQQRYDSLINQLKGMNPQDINGYKTDRPPESHYLEQGQTLEHTSSQQTAANPHAQSLLESAHKRPFLAFDPHNDPLIINSDDAIQDPEKTIGTMGEQRPQGPPYTEELCEESKPESLFTCQKTLLTPHIHIEPARYSNFWCGSGNHQPDDPQCQAKVPCNPPRKYKDEVITVTREEWMGTCQALEKWVTLGFCRQVRQVCTQPDETREITVTIGGKSEGRLIKRPCWRYTVEYRCFWPSANTCQALRQKACEQTNSQVLQSIGDHAVVWQQKFRCYKGSINIIKKPATDHIPLVMPDAGSSLNYTANTDLNETMANLSLLKEIQNDLGLNAASQDKNKAIYQVFRGKQHACDKHTVGFSDCCQSLQGWGQNIGLSRCTAEEKQLAQLRERGLCVEVGTFCAEKEKITGLCLRKRTQYCCFPSALSRLVHQQGRPQLGIGWGEAQHPQCRGFLVEELSRLDFSRLDLRELYADIQARMKEKSESVISRNLSERMKHMTSGGRHDTAGR